MGVPRRAAAARPDYPLANHTWSHLRLNDTTVAAWTADVAKNESVLVDLMRDQDWRWLRYPFLAEGGTPEQWAAARQYLAAHQYKVASVTMSFDDWAYNDPYARCAARGDHATIAALEERWLRAADSALSYYRRLSQDLYGRDISYVQADARRRIRRAHDAAAARLVPGVRRALRDPRGRAA